MLLRLNGPSGGGKTQTAHEITLTPDDPGFLRAHARRTRVMIKHIPIVHPLRAPNMVSG
jgi:hypothetical protein